MDCSSILVPFKRLPFFGHTLAQDSTALENEDFDSDELTTIQVVGMGQYTVPLVTMG